MPEIVLHSDRDWSVIDGEPCRVKVFTPWASVEDDGRVTAMSKTEPYASIVVECNRLPENATGFISHRTDFLHLWNAFQERDARGDAEVIAIWTRKHLKRSARLVAKFMPRLWVMVCPRDAFELMTDPDFRPELAGQARWRAQEPLVEWKPDVME